MKNELIQNINKLHTTLLGVERIDYNLGINVADTVQYCRDKVMDECAQIERLGKNWYVVVGDCRITINAHSYTIITAHKIVKGNTTK